MIFIQDIKSRSVYWFLFPALTVLYLSIHYLQRFTISEELESVSINFSFLAFQLCLVTLYFSIKYRKFTRITDNLIGWGDMLLLISTVFYPSVLNFILFYTLSLVVVSVSWLLLQQIDKLKYNQIPLAGFQALLFACVLIADWWFGIIDVTSDNWILAMIYK